MNQSNSNRTAKSLVTDADGVVINSAPVAWQVATDIMRLLGVEKPIRTREDYFMAFGRQNQEAVAGATGAAYLRDMHRLLMRHRAASIHPFPAVVDVFAALAARPSIVTSAFADGISTSLGDKRKVFATIYGREKGRKEELLRAVLANSENLVYVTDSPRDVRICARLGIQSVSVGWGYHAAQHLAEASPTFHVESPNELQTLLVSLGYAQT